MAVPVIVIVPVAVIIIVVALAVAVVTVVLVLAVVIAVIVSDLVTILVAAEVPFPADMPSPIGVFAVRRKRSVIAEAGIVIMVDVTVEAHRPMEPRSGANEGPADKPLRTIVAEGRALIRRVVEISIGAHRRNSYAYGDLRGSFLRTRGKTESSKNGQEKNPETLHDILLADDF